MNLSPDRASPVSGGGGNRVMERTLAIIKPDAVAGRLVGEIIRRIESANIQIIAMRLHRMSEKDVDGFYYIHRQKPFFTSLKKFMTSGPVVLLVLQGENVIQHWRRLMGSTDPRYSDHGTIRRDMGADIEKNVVHGSDNDDNAVYEINFFFSGLEIFDLESKPVS
jgi:nucleoside-diphosphate kinase